MNKIEKFDKLYMDMAINVAKFSYCKRKQVGCVIVKDDIIVIGYNGTVSGKVNNCEDNDGETLWDVLHAESNALSKIMTSSLNSKDATVYCTFSACIHCSKLLVQAKIKRFVYLTDHSDQRGLDLMRESGIIVEKLN